MPQFVVPQFIDVEDKIIGPITTRQFIMGVVATLAVFLSYKLSDTALFVLEAILIVGAYVLVAFVKINGQPFYQFLLSVIRSLVRPMLRVWSKAGSRRERVSPRAEPPHAAVASRIVPKVRPRTRTLAELSLLVDTGGKYRPEEILAQRAANQNHAEK
ncbi:MAG: PrgI family protein [Parcubacteria group bacterium]|nr:PrgI family protein [Parcubacteria group bacterium]